MIKTYWKFQLKNLEIFSDNKSLTLSHFSNFFLSSYGNALLIFRLLDSNRIYCIMILVMLLGSAYAISVQRIKTLVGFRSMTLAPH